MVLAQLPDQLPDLDDLERIQTDRRLVENDDLRVSENRLCDPDPLSVAFREVFDQACAHFGQSGPFFDALHLFIKRIPPQSLRAADKEQVLVGGHIGVERRQLGQIPDLFFRIHGVLVNVQSVDGDRAGGRGKAPGDDVHRGGFSRAIRTQESVHASLLHGKAHIAHRGKIAVLFGQILDCNQGISS